MPITVRNNSVSTVLLPNEGVASVEREGSSIDQTKAQSLVQGWTTKPLSTDDARALKVALAAGAVKDDAARATLQQFLSTLPGATQATFPALSAPHLATTDVASFTASLAQRTFSPDEAKALEQAAIAAAPRTDAEGRKTLQAFVRDQLPSQVAGGLQRDARTELQIAAMDDGHIDANDAKALVARWSGAELSTPQAQALLRTVLGAKGVIDPGEARETIQGFFDKTLPKTDRGASAKDVDFAAELEGRELQNGLLMSSDADGLTKEWGGLKFSPHSADALKAAVAADKVHLSPQAQLKLTDFIDRNLPKLIVDGTRPADGTVKLAWTPPFANVDGTPLTNLGGYVVEYGKTSGALDQMAVVADPAATGLEIPNLGAGTWYFAARSVTTDGTKSDLSNQASATIP